MRHTLTALLIVGLVAGIAAPARAFHEDYGKAVGDVLEQFRGLANQLGEHLRNTPGLGTTSTSPAPAQAERPLITFILEHREQLALTPEQTTRLETLRQEFTRETIRRDADLRIAEMDLAALLEQTPADLAKVEAKVRELEKLRADLRIARIRAVEQGRTILTPEQRTKLQALLGSESRSARRTPTQGTRL
jgi:Spy/CpxP family protein refolding chaperone